MCRFVIKTVDEKGRKVFINVCGSSSVLAPGGWKNGQVKALPVSLVFLQLISLWGVYGAFERACKHM